LLFAAHDVVVVRQFIYFPKTSNLKNSVGIDANVYLPLALGILNMDAFVIFESMIQVDL
jgi:hypothetical protein